MTRTAFLFLACGVLLFAAAADDEIRNAEKKWADAVVKADAAAMESVYGEKLIYAHSTGVVQTRKEFIDQIGSGQRKYDSVVQEPMRIEVYGGAAVAHYLARMTGNVEKVPFNDRVMVMHFWVRQGGQWRLVAHQTTKVK